MSATMNSFSVSIPKFNSLQTHSNVSTPSSMSSSMSFSIGITPALPIAPEDVHIVDKQSDKNRKNLSDYNIEEFNQVLIDSLSILQFKPGYDINVNKIQSLNLNGLSFIQSSEDKFAELLFKKCKMQTFKAKQLYKYILQHHTSDTSMIEHDEKKQFEDLCKLQSKNVDNTHNKPSEHIINDRNWVQFNKNYKYKHTKVNNDEKSVTIIRNYHNLCFKEFIYESDTEFVTIYNEYKALTTYYRSLYGTDEMVKLYLNNKCRARLVMKYHPGEDLDDFLVDDEDGEVGFLYENDFRVIMKRILEKLLLIHSNGILHCDLKPNNIRINEQSDKYEEDDPMYYDINIIDFGYAHIMNKDNKSKSKSKSKSGPKKVKSVKLNMIKGTPGYMAPEIIRNKKYSVKSDIFAIGCIAFMLITNQYAVIQSDSMEIEEMMPDRKRLKHLLKRENDRNRDEESMINQKTIDFVLSCLWKNPSKRPTVEDALNNKIFKNIV